MIEELELLGVRHTNHKLLTSYLSNRKQQTFANNTMSARVDITCGVPQGSILGPLFFLIYVNDLPNCIQNSSSHLYADDTVVYNKHKDLNSTVKDLQGDLSRVEK